MAAKKVENFLTYHALFPEYRVVWLGDSGQGDILVGLQLQQWYAKHSSTSSSGVCMPPPVSLIHDICHSSQRPYNDPAARSAYREQGVELFDSYVDAAVIAYKRGLLSSQGLRYVVDTATTDVLSIRYISETQRTGRYEDLLAGVRRAKSAMRAALPRTS